MKKYLGFAKMAWQESLEYRGEGLIWLLLELGGLFPILCLWLYLYNHQKVDLPLLKTLISYNIVVIILNRATTSDFEYGLIDRIRNGIFSYRLVRPFNSFLQLVISEFIRRLHGMIYLTISLVVILPFIIKFIDFEKFNLNLLIILPLVVLIFIQRCLISFMIALGAFWFEHASMFMHLKWMTSAIFGGGMIPIFVMPEILKSIAIATPFYYWTAAPVLWIINFSSNINLLMLFSINVLWLLILSYLAYVLWQKALKKHGAYGG